MAVTVREYLDQPGLARILTEARKRVEYFGEVRGTILVDVLTEAEAHELNGLPGALGRRRARAGVGQRISLVRLDAALGSTRFGVDLPAALELVGGPLDDRQLRRADAQAARQLLRGRILAHPLCEDEAVALWAERELSNIGRMQDGRRVLEAALSIGGLLPSHPPVERTRLAAEALQGDPHALDDDTPLARMLLRQMAARDGTPPPSLASDRRALWQQFGVVTDPASCDVLTLGLLPLPNGPLAAAFRGLHGQHLRVTLGQLTREPLRFPPQLIVHVVENPTILTAAEQRLSSPPAMVCTAGWPNSAAALLLDGLCTSGAALNYHGDFDYDGVRISRHVVERFGARPWRYDAAAFLAAVESYPSRTRPVRGRPLAVPEALAQAIADRGRELHEEAVLDELLADLAPEP
ncbi:MAG: TIGR02679 family protein [Solirubrobacteraceae bacterium]